MTQFDKEMIDFIVNPENFDQVAELVEYFPKAKNQLLQCFWQEVSDELSKSPKDGWKLLYK